MAEKVSKEVPIAERIVDFGKGKTKELAGHDLVLTKGTEILYYANEYPIAMYRCNENVCYADIMPVPRLNSFILSITVSTGVGGKRFSVDAGKMEEEVTDFDTLAYYEDPFGIRHWIIQHDICEFLLKKPKLVVSEEGVLVFFTEDEILATTDCQQYAWIRWDGVLENCTSIEDINACNEHCELTLVEGEDVLDDLGRIVKEAPRHVLALNFKLKIADHNAINPIFTKIS